jgi:hypothetical protein
MLVREIVGTKKGIMEEALQDHIEVASRAEVE